ncbi:MAG: class I SAM-dependent methyltransferase [Syntrophales bacterium]
MKNATLTTEYLLSKNIKGFLDDEEALRLYELAREASIHGPCLEIGSYCGKSAAFLGLACQQHGAVLFSIDHHRGSEEQQPGQAYFDPELFDERSGAIDTFPIFRKTLAELSLSDTVVPLVCHANLVARAWQTPLSLIFIDGSHTFASACGDYLAWASHLQPGGFLIIHDIFFDPAQGGQAPHCIYELALASGLFVELPMTKTLGVLQRASVDVIPEATRQKWLSLTGQ